MPDEEDQRRLFLAASNYMEAEGYVHYEISNFARRAKNGRLGGEHDPLSGSDGGPSLCRHNLKYWDRTPYLGLGPSAHSFLGSLRWWNHRSLARYCKALDLGQAPLAGWERLSEEQARLERLFLALRTRSGMALEELLQYPNAEAILSDLLRQGYVHLVRERVVPTEEGFLVADRLPLILC